MKKIIIIWYRAVFCDYRYWRILYKDGRKSYLLRWGEASGVSKIYDGKLYIDYTVEL